MSFCGECGARLKEGASFCTKCGSPIVQAPASQAPDAPVAQAAPSSMPAPTPGYAAPQQMPAPSPQMPQAQAGQGGINTQATQALPRGSKLTSKAKSLGTSPKKLVIIFGAAAVAAVLILVALVKFLGGSGVDPFNNVSMSFSGYDGAGTASISPSDYTSYLCMQIAENQGISKALINELGASNNVPTDLATLMGGNALSNATKLTKITNYCNGVSYSISKASGLSNGDSITLTVNTTSTDNPVKPGTKTFKVSGLQASTNYTIQDLLKQNPITLSGFNHFGSATFAANIWSVSVGGTGLTQSNNGGGTLSNGDKYTITLSDSYILSQQQNGKVLKGAKTMTATVSGLPELKSISNIAALLTQSDALAGSQFQNQANSCDNYTVSRGDSYIFGGTTDNNGSSTSGSMAASLVSVYRVVDTQSTANNFCFTNSTNTYYVLIGYGNVPVAGNAFTLADLSTNEAIADTTQYAAPADAYNKLASEFPNLQKVN